MPSSKNTFHAILISCIGWTGFAVSDACVKFLARSYSVEFLLFVYAVFLLATLGLYMAFTKGAKSFRTPKLKWLAIRGLFVTLTAVMMVSALGRDIPLPDFYGIVFTTPFFILAFSKLFLKEHVGWHRTIAAIIGFSGVLMITGASFSAFHPGHPFALAGAVVVAINAMIARKIGGQEFWPLYLFFPAITTFAYSAFPALSDWTMPAPGDLPLLALYVLAVSSAQIAFVYAFAKTPLAAVIAPFQYMQMLWGILFSIVIFSEMPPTSTFLGAAVIIGAGLYVIRREYMLAKQVRVTSYDPPPNPPPQAGEGNDDSLRQKR